MEYSTYSSSIQKTSVFINPSLEISNGGISYFNTFLVDLTNCILIETINRSKQAAQTKYLSVDAIQDAINQIFSYELSEYIIDQSQGRIQHTSMKNLPKYNPESTRDEISGDEDEDEDVKDFEIIPRDSNVSAQNVSLFFPTELVYQVCQDMIRRKMTIHTNTDFYEPVQLQSRDSFIFTYLSYCMESVTTRILKRLSDSSRNEIINEDSIRKTISDDNILKEIRHKAVQINNITNRLLEGHSIDSIPNLSSSLTTSTISDSIVKQQQQQQQQKVETPITLVNVSQSELVKETVVETPSTKIVEPELRPTNDSLPTSPKPTLSNIESNTQSNTSSITQQSQSVNNQEIVNNINNNNNINTTTITSPITPTSAITTPAPAVITPIPTPTVITPSPTVTKPSSLPKESSHVVKRNTKNENVIATSSSSVTKKEVVKSIPSLLFVETPFDLIQALKNDHILLEKSNGIFLIFLILIGLLLQSCC